jgi:hypothetical protein
MEMAWHSALRGCQLKLCATTTRHAKITVLPVAAPIANALLTDDVPLDEARNEHESTVQAIQPKREEVLAVTFVVAHWEEDQTRDQAQE